MAAPQQAPEAKHTRGHRSPAVRRRMPWPAWYFNVGPMLQGCSMSNMETPVYRGRRIEPKGTHQ